MALPAVPMPSLQYDLFTQFFGRTEDLSNTIDLWDAIPKFAFSARRQYAARARTRRHRSTNRRSPGRACRNRRTRRSSAG